MPNGGTSMTNVNESREIPVTNLPVKPGPPEQAVRRAIEGVLRLGVNLVSIPVVLLPPESRAHMEVASREFADGLVALAREVANRVEHLAQVSPKQSGAPANKSFSRQ
jgi:hypothetical protein